MAGADTAPNPHRGKKAPGLHCIALHCIALRPVGRCVIKASAGNGWSGYCLKPAQGQESARTALHCIAMRPFGRCVIKACAPFSNISSSSGLPPETLRYLVAVSTDAGWPAHDCVNSNGHGNKVHVQIPVPVQVRVKL